MTRKIVYTCSLLFLTFSLFGCGTNEGAIEAPVNESEHGTIDDRAAETTGIDNIHEFELEIDLVNNEELEMEYKNRGGSPTGEVDRKTQDGKVELKGEQALTDIENLLQQIALQPDTNAEEAVDQILASMNIAREDIGKFELEVDFVTGEKLKANL